MVTIDHFKKTEIRVAKILEATDHPHADKLIVLKIDLAEEEPRQIIAGIKGHYTNEELIGKKILVVSNLTPVELRGEPSNGMLLAGRTEDKVIVVSPDEDIPVGTRLS